ncbi:Rho guanine nucleotide exchange factor 7 [Striga asiatica]|uniref:Rho guanine nucleotide exchange factor 7 n=1 Tax=Striga asiatica TaxID=4170 RepID=A0A5A7Q078_STRAF|nr:Rho guanine nucleotide exchange factor 7 [Striga asiatica]
MDSRISIRFVVLVQEVGKGRRSYKSVREVWRTEVGSDSPSTRSPGVARRKASSDLEVRPLYLLMENLKYTSTSKQRVLLYDIDRTNPEKAPSLPVGVRKPEERMPAMRSEALLVPRVTSGGNKTDSHPVEELLILWKSTAKENPYNCHIMNSVNNIFDVSNNGTDLRQLVEREERVLYCLLELINSIRSLVLAYQRKDKPSGIKVRIDHTRAVPFGRFLFPRSGSESGKADRRRRLIHPCTGPLNCT